MIATQNTSEPENTIKDKSLCDDLICPSTDEISANLIIDDNSVHCPNLDKRFPLFKCGDINIPWLYEYPEIHLIEWQARLNGFLHINDVEVQNLKTGLSDKRLSKIGQNKIRKLINAKKQQREQILSLLEPFDFQNCIEVSDNIIGNFQSKIPKAQGLTSYYDNIFRDWAWGNDENQQMLRSIENVYNDQCPVGKVLTIGAGAGRLSYDLHQKYSADYSLLLDINPLLMSVACNVIQGKTIELNEFPIAPINKNSFFATQNCCAPNTTQGNFEYLLADGMNPPIKNGSFDTVLTPWLLDIIPQNLRDYIPRINRCIRKDGIWLNTGSLAFFHKETSWCYSEEEVIELLEKSGFELVKSQRSTIEYMKSPLSAHGRLESVFSFCARKIKDVAQPKKYEYLPNWVRNTTHAIPKKYEFEISSSRYLLQAQVLGAIDGKRNIEQIGELVAKQYNLEIDESIHAVKQILISSYEDT